LVQQIVVGVVGVNTPVGDPPSGAHEPPVGVPPSNAALLKLTVQLVCAAKGEGVVVHVAFV
jgi:hypothetical protein